MQFKGNSQALYDQYRSDEVNPMLRVAQAALDAYTYEYFKKHLVITCVLRLPLMQVDWCEKGNYKSRFEHTAGEAIDIRSRNLNEKEIEQILCFARSYLSGICKLEYHTKGTGKHFHLTTAGYRRRQDKICEIVETTPGASDCFAG